MRPVRGLTATLLALALATGLTRPRPRAVTA
jgi:hypothetical protein